MEGCFKIAVWVFNAPLFFFFCWAFEMKIHLDNVLWRNPTAAKLELSPDFGVFLESSWENLCFVCLKSKDLLIYSCSHFQLRVLGLECCIYGMWYWELWLWRFVFLGSLLLRYHCTNWTYYFCIDYERFHGYMSLYNCLPRVRDLDLLRLTNLHSCRKVPWRIPVEWELGKQNMILGEV